MPTLRARGPRRSLLRSRSGRVLAGAVAATVAVASVSLVNDTSASAATAPAAQSAGNFLDALLGGQPLDSILKLQYARAQAPGSTSTQNPLDVTALNAINLPLTGALQLPQILGINLGAAQQVALAKLDGESFGGAGAVNNSGGVSVGGAPATTPPTGGATINLTASGIAGNNPVPIPIGTGSADALGGVVVQVGAVSSLARTPQYGPALPTPNQWPSACTQSAPTCYDIAGLKLQLGSPLLGGIFTQLAAASTPLVTLLQQVGSTLGASFPASCKFNVGQVPATISLDNGAVTIDSATATITVDLEALLQTLKLDLNNLPANTDLLKYVLDNLSTILSTGLINVVNGILDPLQTAFASCLQDLGPLGQALGTLLTQLQSAGSTLETQLQGLATQLGAAGAAGLDQLNTLLGQLLDIGVNVQPNVATGNFKTKLSALPKQNETPPPPVPYQYVVRGLEVQLLGGSINLALANSAAGPSNPAAAPSTSAAPTSTALPTALPTGVPAGEATHGGPVAPIVLLIVGLALAAAGSVAWRVRGRHAG